MEFRKTLLIIINSIASTLIVLHRGLLMMIVLYLTCILVVLIRPYRKEYLNNMHYAADFVALLSFGIAVAVEISESMSKKYILFLILVIMNASFII